MSQVYADFAAATPIDRRVMREINRVQKRYFANPSAVHADGQLSRQLLEKSRKEIAGFIGVSSEEIYFTASGTEANNLAILGVARANRHRGQHIITTNIEHPSVQNACLALKKDNFRVTYLTVDRHGLVNPADLVLALTKDTILVSIHLANSVLGVIQPIAKLSRICREHQTFFHTDACQAAGYLPIVVDELGVDLLTFNGSKIYAGKGTGVLFVSDSVDIFPMIYGGNQERSLRSGTENLPALAGLAKAVKIIMAQSADEGKRIGRLRDRLQSEVAKIPSIKVDLVNSPRLANYLTLTFSNWLGGSIVEAFDRLQVSLSAAGACSSRELSQSAVYKAIGLDDSEANATVRITLGRTSTADDLKRITKAVQKITGQR